jgi:hypothetical protein
MPRVEIFIQIDQALAAEPEAYMEHNLICACEVDTRHKASC